VSGRSWRRISVEELVVLERALIDALAWQASLALSYPSDTAEFRVASTLVTRYTALLADVRSAL